MRANTVSTEYVGTVGYLSQYMSRAESAGTLKVGKMLHLTLFWVPMIPENTGFRMVPKSKMLRNRSCSEAVVQYPTIPPKHDPPTHLQNAFLRAPGVINPGITGPRHAEIL
jgi:hypothetical protein